jgi:hypothetical protein
MLRHQMISPDTEFRPNLPPIFLAGRLLSNGGLDMASERTDTAIEKIIASCDGNMRGALEALLRVNEFLETELQQLYATISSASTDVETVH